MDVATERLRNQGIAARAARGPVDVVATLGAIQAQDYLGGLWAVGVRLPGATEGSVEQALTDGSIVRTWPMRGTLHFVPSADARWMLELMTPRVLARNASRDRELELDDGVFAQSRRVFVAALRGGQRLSRPALYERLHAAGVGTGNSRGLHILSYLSQQRVICFAGRAGKQQTFALFDEWIPSSRPMARDAALVEICRRYFTSHGPATVRDFVWWSGLTARDARAALEALAGELEHETIGGTAHWYAPAERARRTTTPTAHLLPPFDEFTVAYRDRGAVLEGRFAGSVASGGILKPTIVIDGRVVGVWTRVLKGDRVIVTPQPFARLTRAARNAVAAAAERYGRFLERAASLD